CFHSPSSHQHIIENGKRSHGGMGNFMRLRTRRDAAAKTQSTANVSPRTITIEFFLRARSSRSFALFAVHWFHIVVFMISLAGLRCDSTCENAKRTHRSSCAGWQNIYAKL